MSFRTAPIEYAMTHRVGLNGLTERCQRPNAVLETALRVRKWGAQHEVCQSCSFLPAVRLTGGVGLCGRCHEQRLQRTGAFTADRVGLAPRAEPADDGAILRGLAIVFGKPSVDMGFVEYIKPSAADRNEAEGIDVRALWSHNTDFTIGRMSAGTLRTRKTRAGVAVEIDPPKWGAQYVESVRRRDVTGMSFAFETVEDEWHIENEEPVRNIVDMRYFEVSGVSFPAYPDTTLDVADGKAREWHREQQTAERLRMAR